MYIPRKSILSQLLSFRSLSSECKPALCILDSQESRENLERKTCSALGVLEFTQAAKANVFFFSHVTDQNLVTCCTPLGNTVFLGIIYIANMSIKKGEWENNIENPLPDYSPGTHTR